MDFQTPRWVGELMISRVEGDPRTILEPTPGEGKLIEVITYRYPEAKIENFCPPSFADGIEEVDYIIANPPFTPMKLGYSMLEQFFEWSGNIIVLMPWLAVINSERRTQRYLEKGLKEVIHLPRRAFPGARVQTCIMVFKRGYQGEINLGFAK